MTTTRKGAEPAPIYLCDNGAVWCRNHLGETARRTGRDLSGQPMMAVPPGMAGDLACETCAEIDRRQRRAKEVSP
jgi:hypothetical protein